MTMNEALILLGVALLGGLGTLATTFMSGGADYLKTWWRIKKQKLIEKNTAEGFRIFGSWSYAIQMLERYDFVDRVIIFCGQNGGGIPKIGYPYTIRGGYAWSRNSNEDLYNKYNFRLKIDSSYYNMLADLIEKKVVVNVTEKMDPECVLKAMYIQEGVVSSVLYFLHINGEDNIFYYISIASYKAEFTKTQLNLIEPAVQRLRSMYSEADNY